MILQLIQSIDPTVNPRHVLAFILEEHGVTDHLSKDQIQREVELYKEEWKPDSDTVWEAVADSLHL
jgi:hypothetical protein